MKDGKPVIIEVKTHAYRQSFGSAVRCVFVALHKCDHFLHSRELNFGHFGSLCIYEGHSSFYLLLQPDGFINWVFTWFLSLQDIFVTEIEVTIFFDFRDCTWIHPSIS